MAEYQTPNGIYESRCGLDKVHLSWGHDEYIYQITRDYLPEPAQYMLRYHSFYPAHKHGVLIVRACLGLSARVHLPLLRLRLAV